MQIQTIQPETLHAMLEQGHRIELIDVRTPAEFQEVHAAPARNVPLDSLAQFTQHNAAAEPLYVICKSGARSQQACRKLAPGFAAISIDGGTDAWVRAGLPVIRGKKTISLERQVRIAAGFLVFSGTLLANFLHPYFFVLPAFVGAGLMFAGITDTCGMAMLLARMPWNRGVKCDLPLAKGAQS